MENVVCEKCEFNKAETTGLDLNPENGFARKLCRKCCEMLHPNLEKHRQIMAGKAYGLRVGGMK